MGRVRRRFDVKFKEQICQQVLSGTELREVCQEHQLGRQTVERWLAKFESGEALGKPSAKEKMLEKQVEQLHTKIGQMAVQIDLLKKLQEFDTE